MINRCPCCGRPVIKNTDRCMNCLIYLRGTKDGK